MIIVKCFAACCFQTRNAADGVLQGSVSLSCGQPCHHPLTCGHPCQVWARMCMCWLGQLLLLCRMHAAAKLPSSCTCVKLPDVTVVPG